MNEQNIQRPKNYLVWSILATLLCCLPLGIAAIIYSVRVDSEWSAGHHEEAVRASGLAKKLVLVSVFGAVALFALYFLFIVVIASANA
ncbi:MAG: CD225/dispanin family protein [Alistipes sp.]|nr:CD225/dispanin family protein [Alistipes sp.]MBQ5807735.1 CD225/dispanin family protein [Tidjanibacter sp.]MBQ1939454.1 CD225/dispanin family protein [Alistipes sp.]MBQ2393902.1 CD225/dispanin family protein [Alistipes sp.]MBQ5394793.1 CD225/dispanin family protein [Alistipes sp.]